MRQVQFPDNRLLIENIFLLCLWYLFQHFFGAYLEWEDLAYGCFTYCMLIELIHTYLCFFALIFPYFDQISKNKVH